MKRAFSRLGILLVSGATMAAAYGKDGGRIRQAAGQDDAPPRVPAAVQYTDGSAETFMFVDRELRVRTVAGEMIFLPGQLARIRWDKGARWNEECRIETVCGDEWNGLLEDNSFDCSGAKDTVKLKLSARAIKTIEFTENQKRARPIRLGEEAVVVFNDGEKVRVVLQGLCLSIKNTAGEWDLPLASVARVTLNARSASGIPTALTAFPSGFTQVLALSDPEGSLSVTDMFGHRIKLRLASISVIDVAKGITKPDVAPALPEAEIARATTVGGVKTMAVPLVVWTARGAIGPVSVPSPLVAQISRDKDGKTQRLVTCYGDVLTGRVQPSVVEWTVPSVPRDRKTTMQLDLNKYSMVEFTAPELAVPAGWLRWTLVSGDSVYARPAAAEINMTGFADKARLSVKPEEVDSIVRLDDGNFALDTATEGMRMAIPERDAIDVILFCDGSRRRIEWNRVENVMRLRMASTAAVEEVAVPRTDEKRAPPVERNLSGAIVVKTCLGKLAVPRSLIAEVVNDARNGYCLLRTVFGGVLVAQELDKAQLLRLGMVESVKQKDAVVHGIKLAQHSGLIPSGYLAWQLRTGDRFYARICGRRDLHAGGDRIRAIRRNEKGELVAEAGDKGIEIALNRSSIDISLLSVDGTNALPLSLVEAAGSCKVAELPPLVSVIRGADLFLADTALINGGTFVMGRKKGQGLDDELPPHSVTVGSFYMDRCEITRAQFDAFADATGYKSTAERTGRAENWSDPGFTQTMDQPVVCVSWFDAVEFCNWRSKAAGFAPCYVIDAKAGTASCDRTKNGYRLPTEAEWEFAASAGGQDVLYPWGDADPDSGERDAGKAVEFPANYCQAPGAPRDEWIRTSPVKAQKPNAAGLYAMAGNAWEWCEDWYDEQAYRAFHVHHPVDPCVDTLAGKQQGRRVMRGGSFDNDLDSLRCASRGGGVPFASAGRVGFRCVRNAAP